MFHTVPANTKSTAAKLLLMMQELLSDSGIGRDDVIVGQGKLEDLAVAA